MLGYLLFERTTRWQSQTAISQISPPSRQIIYPSLQMLIDHHLERILSNEHFKILAKFGHF